jgi:hypothetical protein
MAFFFPKLNILNLLGFRFNINYFCAELLKM